MSDEHSENVSTVPQNFEYRSDYLAYSNKNQWLPSALLYVILFFVLLGIAAIGYYVLTGQFGEIKKSTGFSNVTVSLLVLLVPCSLGAFFDILMILFVNYEEFYRLDKEGYYSEERKLYGKITRKNIPLNSIDQFKLDSRIDYDKDNSSTTWYCVNIISENNAIKILENTESAKEIPEQFVLLGNQVLANLTGRDLNDLITPSDAQNSTISDNSSADSQPPVNFQPQNNSPLSALSNNNPNSAQPVQPNFGFNNPGFNAPLYTNLSVPPNCVLRADYLSYTHKASTIMTVLLGIMFAVTLLASICYFTGVLGNLGTNASWFVVVTLISLFAFLSSFSSKEQGRLDKTGFHFENKSLLERTAQDIPLDSILGFRIGKQSSRSKNGPSISYFVELVTSEQPLRLLEGSSDDNYLRRWLIDSGNALLANLKKKAAETQKFKEKIHSDNTMDVSDFNDSNE